MPDVPAIAIIDDDPVYRKVITYLLKKGNYKILFEAEHGAVGIRMYAGGNTLILLDVEMRVMDGFETARLLKVYWPQVKIIANSAILDLRVRNKMITSGADQFIVKDYSCLEITKIIQQAL